MSTVPDPELRAHAENARGKVVVITGGALGLGKQAGREFIRAGFVPAEFPTFLGCSLQNFRMMAILTHHVVLEWSSGI